MAGEEETGVTIMRVVKALDAGPMVAKASRAIGPNETSVEVEGDLARSVRRFFAKLWMPLRKDVRPKSRRMMPWPPTPTSWKKARATSTGPGPHQRFTIRFAAFIRGHMPSASWTASGLSCSDPTLKAERHNHNVVQGRFSRRWQIGLSCRQGDGVLRLLSLQPEGRRAMSAREFLAGRRVRPGARFLRFVIMIAPARTAAFTALCEIDAGRLDLPAALTQVRPTLQDERDRALATDLVTGTLRWQRQLDHLITEFSKRPIEQTRLQGSADSAPRRLQLVHLDRVPAAAAVNDAVAMTRRARKTSAAGLVNAVLRGISRNTHRLPLPRRPPEGDALDYLEISLSHPRWLAKRWLTRYGFDGAERWETFNNTAAPITIRVNR